MSGLKLIPALGNECMNSRPCFVRVWLTSWADWEARGLTRNPGTLQLARIVATPARVLPEWINRNAAVASSNRGWGVLFGSFGNKAAPAQIPIFITVRPPAGKNNIQPAMDPARTLTIMYLRADGLRGFRCGDVTACGVAGPINACADFSRRDAAVQIQPGSRHPRAGAYPLT